MNETTEQPAAIATEPPAEAPVARTFPTTDLVGVQRERIEPLRDGLRPLTIPVIRVGSFPGAGGVIGLDGHRHGGGTAYEKRQEAKRLQREADEQERREKEKAAEDTRFNADLIKAEERTRAEIVAETAAMVKRTPGSPSSFACPRCSGAGAVAIVKAFAVKRPRGEGEYRGFASIGSPVFLMRKTGELLKCPNPACGHVVMVF